MIETQRDQLTLNKQETDEHIYVRLWGKNEQNTGSPYEEKCLLNSHHTWKYIDDIRAYIKEKKNLKIL